MLSWTRFSNPQTASASRAQDIVSYVKRGADPFELCLRFPDLTLRQCDRIIANVRQGTPIPESVRSVEHTLRSNPINPHCSHVWVVKALMDDGQVVIADIFEDLEDAQREERRIKALPGVKRTGMDLRPVK